MGSSMLAQRLVSFLDYNSQQYIDTRSRRDYTAALGRLEKMRKLVLLIRQVCTEGRGQLTVEAAVHVLSTQRHLHALHILPPDEMPSDPTSLCVMPPGP